MTLKELSHLSGYSVSTISKALNNKEDVSINTKAEISKMAQKYKYKPNKMAMSLRMKKFKTVAVILPCLTLNCFSQALHNIQKSAEELGYDVVIYQYGLDQRFLYPFLENMDKSMIDGLIILAFDKINSVLLPEDIPLVVEEFYEVEFNNFIKWKSKQTFLKLEQLL